MKQWNIKALYYGKITAIASLIWPAGMPPLKEDFEVSAPYWGFLLRSDERTILVDTGINQKFTVDGKAWGALPAEGGAAYVTEALKKEDLSVDDIDMVVLTHLHNDHAGNCGLFKKARIIYQKDEWHNFMNPIPQQLMRMDYDFGIADELKTMKTIMVDGDVEIAEGVKLFKIPGHSQGSQAVAVNTRKGTVVLIGDLCLVNFMIFPGTAELVDMEGKVHALPAAPAVFGNAIPSSIIYNFFDFYSSISRIKAVATRDEPGYIIPGHEPSLMVTGI